MEFAIPVPPRLMSDRDRRVSRFLCEEHAPRPVRGPALLWAWLGPLQARGGAGILPCSFPASPAPHPLSLQPRVTCFVGTNKVNVGRRAGTWSQGWPLRGRVTRTHRQKRQLFHGLRKASVPTDTSPAHSSPAHLGLKPGILPLEVHSFGLEYRCRSEEMTFAPSLPSLALSPSCASAGCRGLCHSMDQPASTSCAPGSCAPCPVWLYKDGLASCEGIVGAEREEQEDLPSTCYGACSMKLITESRLRHHSCLHFTKGGY